MLVKPEKYHLMEACIMKVGALEWQRIKIFNVDMKILK